MNAIKQSKLSLQGLAAGDAFGQRLFGRRMISHIKSKTYPEGIWPWTDDTAMAISIVEVLRDHGHIEQDALAAKFAERYRLEPNRGYGSGAHYILDQLGKGGDWRKLAPGLFAGGSFGNGAAMRIAPLGAYFAGNPEKAKEEAIKSAVITHSHPEAQAGAIAVAVAAALTAAEASLNRSDFISHVEGYIPESEVRDKVRLSKDIPAGDTSRAAHTLGTGMNISAQDTAPFCIWCAANHLNDFEAALWQTVSGAGDQDTTCAIVGGIVASSAGTMPRKLLEHIEPLPDI